jgi:hypothetical protein
VEALRPPVEEGGRADEGGLRLQGDTAPGLRLLEVLDRGEMPIDERRVGERPEVFGGLQLGGVGWEEVEIDVVGHAQAQTGVPPRPIEDQDDLFVGTGSRLASEGGELRLEEGNIHARRQMEQRLARRRVNEPDKIAPFIAVLNWRHRPLSLGRPDPPQDRLEPDAVFVDRPHFDGGCRKRGRHLPQERPQFFLKRAWAAG